MSKSRSETEALARQLYRDQKHLLDLIKKPTAGLGFEEAMRRIFGEGPPRGQRAKLAKQSIDLFSVAPTRVSLLPASWTDALDPLAAVRIGCENWWAGYPLILWVEMRVGDDGVTGQLILNGEVGPVRDHRRRKGLIRLIRTRAAEERSTRIQFPPGSADKGRLYTRFLRQNAMAVENCRNADEVEQRFLALLAAVKPEIDLIARIFPALAEMSKSDTGPALRSE